MPRILHNKYLYISLGSLILAGVLLLALLNYIIMPAYTNFDEGVTVPDITNISLSEAQHRLSSDGLRFEVSDRRSSSAIPADYVIDQTPKASEIVKPNRKVYLTVNTVSNPTVEVPDVVNLSKRNAEIQLQNHGLKVGTISYQSSRFKNSVLRQSVPAKKVVPKGTTIDLSVSDGLGQKTVDMPNIRGLRLSEAQQKLQQAGLRVGEIQFKPSKKVSPNVILDFEPHKREVVEGETIKLIVAERYEVKEEQESGAIVDSANATGTDSN